MSRRHKRPWFLGNLTGLAICSVNRVGFGRRCQVNHALSERQLPLRRSNTLERLLGCHSLGKHCRVRHTTILHGKPHQSSGNVIRMLSSCQYACQPITRRIRIIPPHAFVRRGDQVVTRFLGFVIKLYGALRDIREASGIKPVLL